MRPIGGLCLACLSPASEKAFMTPIREARSIVLEPPRGRDRHHEVGPCGCRGPASKMADL